jgi:hypothetical protein
MGSPQVSTCLVDIMSVMLHCARCPCGMYDRSVIRPKALTLSSLIRNGTISARSLSALLLARGITIRTLEYHKWNDVHVQRNIIPPQPKLSLSIAHHDEHEDHDWHCDRCQIAIGCDALQGCLFATRNCSLGRICAPNIGCTTDNTTNTINNKDNNNNNNVNELVNVGVESLSGTNDINDMKNSNDVNAALNKSASSGT